jgi:hypothetical protein
MNQLVFLTLFLGLTAGVQPVTLGVSGSVAKVELRLDDRVVATFNRAPWTAQVDFGATLAPHRLVAIGLDGSGQEIVRAEQKINVPRLPAEATLLFQSDKRVAVRWTSIDGQAPKSVELTVDGKRLDLDRNREAILPALSATVPHFIQATVESATGDVVQTHAVYGGASSEDTGALTAIPITVAVKMRDPIAVDGFFSARGASANIVAVEKPPAEVILVRDPSEAEAVVRYGRPKGDAGEAPGASFRGIGAIGVAAADDVFLSKETTMRFLWPFAVSGNAADLFPSSRSFDKSRGGFRFLLTSVSAPASSPKMRFADAVGVAGLQALAKQRRRAVVLIIGRSYHDESQLTPKQTRDFLDGIGVPLFVWSLADAASLPPEAAAWGSVASIDTYPKLRDAVRTLARVIDAQRIVWIAGDYLPQEIRATSKAAGIALLASSTAHSP